MTKQELIDLVAQYPEWNDSLDETCCPTGFVDCPVCDGGGYLAMRKSYSVTARYAKARHRADCPRAKFEKEYFDKSEPRAKV